MKKTFLAICLFFFAITSIQSQTLAFPTAEGFGKYATGGRGGEVVEVTTLLDDPSNPPEGSFRWALKQHKGKPITIVFRVSGIIDLKGNELRNNRSDITIAGQTAPGDGICIKGGNINLGGSRNLIIRHLRSRVGVLGADDTYCPGTVDVNNFIEGASLNIENGGNFIIDHCSFSWSAEENVGMYDNDHTTLQWCIISEGLYNAGHGKGNRGYGAVWGGKTATYHHNLLAHNYNRSPRLGATTKNDRHMLLDIVNNVNYNYGRQNACYGGDNRQGNVGLFQVNYVNNYYKPGPARTGDQKAYFIGASFCNPSQGSQGTSYGDWHLDGNYMDGTWAKNNGVNTNNYKAFDISAYQENVPGLTLADMKSDYINVGEYAINMESAQDAYNSVLAKAGAFPRDAHDLRIIEETKNGTAEYYGCCSNGRAKGIIDKPSDSGGYPTYNTYNEVTDNDHDGMDDTWEREHGYDPTNAADRNIIVKGGYTALEAYLCSLCGEFISTEPAEICRISLRSDVPSAAGTFSLSPVKSIYEKDDIITLTATYNYGYRFVQWEDEGGNVLSTDSVYRHKIEKDIVINAVFRQLPVYSLNLTAETDGSYQQHLPQGIIFSDVAPCQVGTETGYEQGHELKVYVKEHPIFRFSSWEDGSSDNPRILKMDDDKQLTANFTQEPFLAAWTFAEIQYDYYQPDMNPADITAEINLLDSKGNYITFDRGEGYFGGASAMDKSGGMAYFEMDTYVGQQENVFVWSKIKVLEKGYSKYLLEYSIDYGDNYVSFSSCELPALDTWASLSGNLPAAALREEAFKLRWIPDYTSKTLANTMGTSQTVLSDVVLLDLPSTSLDSSVGMTASTVYMKDGILYLQSTETPTKLQIYDMTSRLLLTEENSSRIDLTSLPEGFYLLKVQRSLAPCEIIKCKK